MTDSNATTLDGGPVGRWSLRAVVAVLAVSTVASPALAHGDRLHGSVPHGLLAGTFLVGLALVAVSVLAGRVTGGDAEGAGNGTDRDARRRRLRLAGAVAGVSLAALGAVGLVESQAEPLTSTPLARQWFPVVASGAALVVVVASLVVVPRRWPDRPSYLGLGLASGLWIGYSELVPGFALHHPLGYLLVAAIPLLVGWIYRQDVAPSLAHLEPAERWFGAAIGVAFGALFLVSSGLFTLNPLSSAIPEESFVVVTSFSNPLVTWPAIEFYVASVPLFGSMSLGTAVVVGLLAALVGVNAGLGVSLWRRGAPVRPREGVFGGLATTGATACCCCGPAAYGIASGLFGATATPLYWAFVDPLSPVGSIFLVGAVGLLLASAVQLAGALDARE